MRLRTTETTNDTPTRMHRIWVDAYHQDVAEGAGPALRSADEAESARAALAFAKENLERLRGDLESIRTARIATANMRSVATTSGESTFWKGDHVERAHEAVCTKQLAIETAVINDLELRIEDWISGAPLPPETPPTINPLSEDEQRFYDADPAIVLQRVNGNVYTNAGRRR